METIQGYFINLSTVPTDMLQQKIVEHTIQYLGEQCYNQVEAKFKQVFTKRPGYFVDAVTALSIVGVCGFLATFLLIKEWELDEHILDFDEHMNLFLDLIISRKYQLNSYA